MSNKFTHLVKSHKPPPVCLPPLPIPQAPPTGPTGTWLIEPPEDSAPPSFPLHWECFGDRDDYLDHEPVEMEYSLAGVPLAGPNPSLDAEYFGLDGESPADPGDYELHVLWIYPDEATHLEIAILHVV